MGFPLALALALALAQPQRFPPANVKTIRQFQGIMGASSDARLAERAFCGKHPFPRMNVIGNSDIHRAHFGTGITIVAFRFIRADFQQREAAGEL